MNYIGPKELTLRPSNPRAGKRKRQPDLPNDILPIFAVDPGGITGWSLLVLRRIHAGTELLSTNQDVLLNRKIDWWHGQIDCHDEPLGAYQLKRIIDDWPSAAIVFEDFWVRQLGVDLSPVTIMARIDDYLWNKGRIMFKQAASQAKTTATDDRLKLWGCYQREGGLNHARDADRHAILFMRRCIGAKGTVVRNLAWPHIYGNMEAERKP